MPRPDGRGAPADESWRAYGARIATTSSSPARTADPKGGAEMPLRMILKGTLVTLAVAALGAAAQEMAFRFRLGLARG